MTQLETRGELANTRPPSEPIDLQAEMIASIQRTGLLSNKTFIPGLSVRDLDAGNREVLEAHGEAAPRLLIVGPDAMTMSGMNRVVRLYPFAAEFLGHAIWLRQMATAAQYKGYGLGDQETGDLESDIIKARQRINDLLADSGNVPITANSGGYGIPDVVVRDMRHSKGYVQQRQQHSQGLFEEYIMDGTARPRMTEKPMVIAAGRALSGLTGLVRQGESAEVPPLTPSQKDRFRRVSHERASLVGSLTEERSAAMPLVTHRHEATYLREEIAEDLEPTWQKRGACRGPQRHLFYPPYTAERREEKQTRERRAKQLCKSCPSHDECLSFAIVNRERLGIWGGTTEDDRRSMF